MGGWLSYFLVSPILVIFISRPKGPRDQAKSRTTDNQMSDETTSKSRGQQKSLSSFGHHGLLVSRDMVSKKIRDHLLAVSCAPKEHTPNKKTKKISTIKRVWRTTYTLFCRVASNKNVGDFPHCKDGALSQNRQSQNVGILQYKYPPL